MWKEVQRTRKKEVLSSHFVESSRPSLTTVRREVQQPVSTRTVIQGQRGILHLEFKIKHFICNQCDRNYIFFSAN